MKAVEIIHTGINMIMEMLFSECKYVAGLGR
jgi:hypothetical protein